MKKQPRIALVAEGRARDFPLNRLRGLLSSLGPVKSSSSRVASRVANTLRAGTPVDRYEQLKDCPAVVICAGNRVRRIVRELSASGLEWEGRTIVSCGNPSGTSDLSEIADQGAVTASLDVVALFNPPHFIVEGDTQAVRFVRTLVSKPSKVFEIAKSSKMIFSSGMTIATSLLAPTAAAAVQCLRLAGLPLRDATHITENAIAGSLRAYVKAGPKGWTGALATGGMDALEQQLEKLRRTDPFLERYLRQNALLALEMFSRNSAGRAKHMGRRLETTASAAGD